MANSIAAMGSCGHGVVQGFVAVDHHHQQFELGLVCRPVFGRVVEEHRQALQRAAMAGRAFHQLDVNVSLCHAELRFGRL